VPPDWRATPLLARTSRQPQPRHLPRRHDHLSALRRAVGPLGAPARATSSRPRACVSVRRRVSASLPGVGSCSTPRPASSPTARARGATLYAVSTYLDGQNRAQCPTLSASQPPPPRPQAGTNFSPNFLTVDCTGQFELCYVIRAGDATRPSPSDCVVARTCTMAWYPEANQRRELPPLPAWTGSDPTCARRFVDGGGYGEMTVRGAQQRVSGHRRWHGRRVRLQPRHVLPLALQHDAYAARVRQLRQRRLRQLLTAHNARG
jgi:hypothetical protein